MKNGFSTKKHVIDISVIRASRILKEFLAGFNFLKDYNKTVTFFGSARANSKSKYYQEAFDLAFQLSKKGYTVVTGGGGGVMEAANKGAYMAGGPSVGINIDLPKEQAANRYVKNVISFRYFFTRKVMLTFASQAYIFLPGGFGTLDEFFEIVTLIQTKKIKKIPVILIHKDYWLPLLEWVDKTLWKEKKTIGKKDMEIYKLVGSPEEALRLLSKK
jgi:uncharacterized protein (TIGR00730 family)